MLQNIKIRCVKVNQIETHLGLNTETVAASRSSACIRFQNDASLMEKAFRCRTLVEKHRSPSFRWRLKIQIECGLTPGEAPDLNRYGMGSLSSSLRRLNPFTIHVASLCNCLLLLCKVH